MQQGPALPAGDRGRVLRGDPVHERAVRRFAVPRIAGDPPFGVQAVELPFRASRLHRGM